MEKFPGVSDEVAKGVQAFVASLLEQAYDNGYEVVARSEAFEDAVFAAGEFNAENPHWKAVAEALAA